MNNCSELIFRKQPKYIIIWLVVIIFMFLSALFIGVFYQYNKFQTINGLVIKEGSDEYVQILLENDKLDSIKNDNLVLNNNEIKFDYEVGSYLYSDGGKVYREVKIYFSNNYKNGQILSMAFKSPKTTLFKEIKNKIKKGMM